MILIRVVGCFGDTSTPGGLKTPGGRSILNAEFGAIWGVWAEVESSKPRIFWRVSVSH